MPRTCGYTGSRFHDDWKVSPDIFEWAVSTARDKLPTRKLALMTVNNGSIGLPNPRPSGVHEVDSWKAANATSCTASGGPNDNWPGTKATSASVVVTEPYAPVTPSVTLTSSLMCTSSVSHKSSQASAMVVEKQGASGGGAFDSLSVVCLFGLLASHRIRQQRRVRS